MSICIVAATNLELGQFHPEGVDVLITGPGTAATIYRLMEFIRSRKPSILVQAGIAGSFDASHEPGRGVVVSADRFADLGVQEHGQWKDVFDLGLIEPAMPPYEGGWLRNPHLNLLQAAGLPIVPAITVNEITTDADRLQAFAKKYSPSVESMEGAAFHYVCIRQQIPFVQLRTISNYIGERNKANWKLKESTQNLAHNLQELVKKLV